MTMISDNWAEALEPGLRGIFTQAMSDYKNFGLSENDFMLRVLSEHLKSI